MVQAGLESLGAVELRNAVAAAFSIQLPATAAFDYPTLRALAGYVASQLTPQGSEHGISNSYSNGEGWQAGSRAPSCTTEIIGVSLQFPAVGSGGIDAEPNPS